MRSNIYERRSLVYSLKVNNPATSAASQMIRQFLVFVQSRASSPKVPLSFSLEQNVNIYFDAIGLFLQSLVPLKSGKKKFTICIIYIMRQITRQCRETRQSVEEQFLSGINYFANWVNQLPGCLNLIAALPPCRHETPCIHSIIFTSASPPWIQY